MYADRTLFINVYQESSRTFINNIHQEHSSRIIKVLEQESSRFIKKTMIKNIHAYCGWENIDQEG